MSIAMKISKYTNACLRKTAEPRAFDQRSYIPEIGRLDSNELPIKPQKYNIRGCTR